MGASDGLPRLVGEGSRVPRDRHGHGRAGCRAATVCTVSGAGAKFLMLSSCFCWAEVSGGRFRSGSVTNAINLVVLLHMRSVTPGLVQFGR